MISEHFHRDEFACGCGCGQDTVDIELLTVLEDIRYRFGYPVHINSGNRCIEYNEIVKKENGNNYIPYSSKSIHMISKAADIRVENVISAAVYRYLNKKYPNKYGIGLYDYFVHVDVRPDYVRW